MKGHRSQHKRPMTMSQFPNTQSAKALEFVQNHKLLQSVQEFQKPVFHEVRSILHKAVKSNGIYRSQAKINKFRYLSNSRELTHQYEPSASSDTKMHSKQFNQPKQPKRMIINPENKHKVHELNIKKSLIEDRQPKISEFKLSSMDRGENQQIQRIHQKLDAYIRANIR